jgi:hypothetical protein
MVFFLQKPLKLVAGLSSNQAITKQMGEQLPLVLIITIEQKR